MQFRFAAGFVAAVGLMVMAPMVTVTVRAGAKPAPETLEVTILTPRDGLALNAAALDIQALASAQRAGRSDDDVWSGWMRIDLAIDGVATQTLDPTACRGQIAAGFRASLTSLAPGSHVATITASKKTRGQTLRGSASLNFVVDPTLPARETNRIEDAATPTPFACLSTPDLDPDDDDRADDYGGRFATLRGSFVPNALSAGLDLAHDRVVLAIDDQLVVIEPGSFVCRAHNRCRFTDKGASLVRSIRLEEKKRGRWTFTIATRHRPWSTRSLFLRIGANWGGLDFVHDRYLAALTPSPDTAHRASATIGSGGGTVQTTDAAGVIITLDVPAGALTADTAIAITPQTGSPLVGPDAAIHPGVDFEPDGLQLAEAAILTFDFSHTSTPVTERDTIFLLTSPLTTLPLYGTVNPAARTLTAEIHRFSDPQPGPGNAARMDAQWVNTALSTPGDLSLAELQSIYAVVAALQRIGQDGGVNTALLTQRTQQTIDARVANYCPYDVANPTDNALARWIQLEALGQGLGVDTSSVRGCEERVLTALITSVGTRALVTGANSDFQRLVSFEQAALSLGFGSLQTLAIQKLDEALRALLGQGQQLCRATTTVTAGQNVLNRALTWVPPVSALGLDPSLAGDIQQAINSCRGANVGTLTAIVRGSPSRRDGVLSSVWTTCSPGPPGGGEGPCDAVFTFLPADQAAPVTLSSPAFTLTVFQLSPNVIAVDATVTAPRGQDGALIMDLFMSGPGTVQVVVNDQWQTSPAGGSCLHQYDYPVAPLPGASASFFFGLGPNFYSAPNCTGSNLSGSGRLLTITLVQ